MFVALSRKVCIMLPHARAWRVSSQIEAVLCPLAKGFQCAVLFQLRRSCVWGTVSINSHTRLPRFDAGHEHERVCRARTAERGSRSQSIPSLKSAKPTWTWMILWRSCLSVSTSKTAFCPGFVIEGLSLSLSRLTNNAVTKCPSRCTTSWTQLQRKSQTLQRVSNILFTTVHWQFYIWKNALKYSKQNFESKNKEGSRRMTCNEKRDVKGRN
jgi:hypothetical protein